MWGLREHLENYIKQERFWPKQRKTIPSTLHFSHILLALTLSIHTFQVKNKTTKKKQEKKQIIFLYISTGIVLLPSIQHMQFNVISRRGTMTKWKISKINIFVHFPFLSRGIILWIELLWPENPTNTSAWYTETLDSCFSLMRSHQQYIPRSQPLEIESATTECRAKTPPRVHIIHKGHKIN